MRGPGRRIAFAVATLAGAACRPATRTPHAAPIAAASARQGADAGAPTQGDDAPSLVLAPARTLRDVPSRPTLLAFGDRLVIRGNDAKYNSVLRVYERGHDAPLPLRPAPATASLASWEPVGDLLVDSAGGEMIAIDARTLAVRWRTPKRLRSFAERGAQIDGVLGLCTRPYGTQDDVMTGVDAATGAVLWEHPWVVYKDSLCGGIGRFGDGFLTSEGVVLDAVTGAVRFRVPGDERSLSAPISTSKRVVVAQNADQSLHLLDPASGALVTKVALGGGVVAMTAADDVVYAIVSHAHPPGSSSVDESVVAVDVATAATVWRSPAALQVASAPSVGGDEPAEAIESSGAFVFAMARDGAFSMLDRKTGRPVWRWTFVGPRAFTVLGGATPAVYVTTGRGTATVTEFEPGSAPVERVDLDGRVVDAEGKPVAKANVFSGATHTTSVGGAFTLRTHARGAVTVQAYEVLPEGGAGDECESFRSGYAGVPLDGGAHYSVTVRLDQQACAEYPEGRKE
jgi:outer membrane protein assembly factor BamB